MPLGRKTSKGLRSRDVCTYNICAYILSGLFSVFHEDKDINKINL